MLASNSSTQLESEFTRFGNPKCQQYLIAFARPFVEAAIYMTGIKPSGSNETLAGAIGEAWASLQFPETAIGHSQIQSAGNSISDVEFENLKSGRIQCFKCIGVPEKLFGL